jgi:hypothetical protein
MEAQAIGGACAIAWAELLADPQQNLSGRSQHDAELAFGPNHAEPSVVVEYRLTF